MNHVSGELREIAERPRQRWNAYQYAGFALLACELFTIGIAHWQPGSIAGGIWLLMAALPWVGYYLAGAGVTYGSVARFGAASVLVLVVRYVVLDLDDLARQFPVPSRPMIAAWLLGASAVMSALCLAGAAFRRGTETQDDGAEAARPQFSIAHMFLAVTCLAVYLAAVRLLHGQMLDAVPSVAFLGLIAPGLTTVALPLFVYRQLRGIAFPRAAGEYLLLVMAIQQVVGLLGGAVRSSNLFLNAPLPSAHAVVSLIEASNLFAASIALAAFPHASRAWRAFLGWFCLRTMLRTYSMLSVGTNFPLPPASVWDWIAWPVVPFALLALAAIGDLRSGQQYSWTHWLGVLAYGAMVCFMLSIGIASWLHEAWLALERYLPAAS